MIYCFIVFIQETIDLEKQLRVSHKQKEKGMHFKLGKNVLITEKPSVAMQMAKALKINTTRKDGYLESSEWIVTWCVVGKLDYNMVCRSFSYNVISRKI